MKKLLWLINVLYANWFYYIFSMSSPLILLMTAAISVPSGMNASAWHHDVSPEERLKDYVSAIVFYITKSKFKNIVFVDGSSYDIKNLFFLKKLGCLYWKNIEFLSFQNDEKQTQEKWKGYGENKIIEYAIINSELLRDNVCFYKVTWRYIIENVNSILEQQYLDSEQVFNKHLSFLWEKSCDTVFFKASKHFFKEFLWWAWEYVNDKNQWSLEKEYFKRLISVKNENTNVKIISSRKLPIYIAKSGTTWKPYKYTRIQLCLKSILKILGFYSL